MWMKYELHGKKEKFLKIDKKENARIAKGLPCLSAIGNLYEVVINNRILT